MMARHRGRGTPPPKPFDGAFTGIDTLEKNVIDRMVDAPFSAEQVVRWMFDDDVVDKLQAAFPVIREVDRTSHFHGELTLPIVFPAVVCNFSIKMNDVSVRCLVPARNLCIPNDARGTAILVTLRQVYEQHLQFEKVRQVVRWLNANCTIGAARHYCPWLTSVLSPEHEFQKATGTIFREPAASMVAIAPVMRECGAIMASALLCGNNDAITHKLVAVSFKGCRDDEAYTSNAFGIV